MEKMIVFQDANGKTNINVKLEENTVWLTQQQMADLFNSSRTNIVEHLQNIYSEDELIKEATCRDYRQVQNEGERSVSRSLPHYNLDAIISVGYRVNSKQGVKFRQWATQTLSDHLVKGFTLNHQHIAERGMVEAQEAMNLLARTLLKQDDLSDESREVLALVSDYAKTWKTLLQYDEQSLSMLPGTPSSGVLEYQEAIADVGQLKQALFAKGEATLLFGQERGESFEGILGNIEQTMFGEPLYKSREEKAANLLYFVIKDHPFSDGNKRIGSFMFLRYMDQQKMNPQISPDTMTALALLVAESEPANKDMMIKLTMNTIIDHTIQIEKITSEAVLLAEAQAIGAEKTSCVEAVNENGKSYEGRVVGGNALYLVQDTGRIAIIHKKTALSYVPKIGDVITVKYNENGKGLVEPREMGRGGNDR